MKSAKKIVKLGLEKFNGNLWIDDVWITGLLRSAANIDVMTSWNQWYTPYVEHLECCLSEPDHHCDFIVAPSNGDASLIRAFGNQSRQCYSHPCFKREWSRSIWSTCHVANPYFLPDSAGIGHVLEAGG